ncbi:MAG: hypothetical protein IKP88_01455 [Lachnospiraceae bacterium]|nr:hypothetical protein [Lachnospiraceae bacterium]
MVSSVLIVIVISYLLIDVIYARANKSRKRWDSNGWRMNFSVRYSDFVVYINSKGVEIEWIYLLYHVSCFLCRARDAAPFQISVKKLLRVFQSI